MEPPEWQASNGYIDRIEVGADDKVGLPLVTLAVHQQQQCSYGCRSIISSHTEGGRQLVHSAASLR
jgi:hypothetical protein